MMKRYSFFKLILYILTVVFFDLSLLAQNNPVFVDIAVSSGVTNTLADSEPSIAVNPADPDQIAVVSFSGNWGPATSAPVWWSNDRGNNWTRIRQIPQPALPAGAPTGAIGIWGPGDQKIAFDDEKNEVIITHKW